MLYLLVIHGNSRFSDIDNSRSKLPSTENGSCHIWPVNWHVLSEFINMGVANNSLLWTKCVILIAFAVTWLNLHFVALKRHKHTIENNIRQGYCHCAAFYLKSERAYIFLLCTIDG